MTNPRVTKIPTVEEITHLANIKGNNSGFKNDPIHKLAKLALIHDEVSEEVHNVSKGVDNCEELVDVIIRIYSYVGALGISGEDFENLIRAKHEKNKARPEKHGKIAN